MRIRIALTLGALVLAGGALTGGIALASDAQAPAAPTQTLPSDPTMAPAPATSRTRPQAPTAVPVPRETTRQKPVTGPAPRVPRAVPAGPTGDLNLPAVWETR